METSTKNDKGNIINDKRCYIIQNEYFSQNKNLNNFLLDESNNNIDGYKKTNITITCKNYGTFFYSGFDPNQNFYETIEPTDIIEKRPSSSGSGIKAWAIILIILAGIIFVAGIIFIVLCFLKKSKKIEQKNEITDTVEIKNNSNNDINKKNDII